MRHPSCSARRAERGAALLGVIVFVLMLLFAATVLESSLFPLVRETSRERTSLRALYVAEGGLATARARLRDDPAWAGGRIEIGGGTALVRMDASGAAPRTRRVHIRGIVPATDAPGAVTERRIAATLRISAGLPAVVDYTERE